LLIPLDGEGVFQAGPAVDVFEKQMPLPQFLLDLARLFIRVRQARTRQSAKKKKGKRFLSHLGSGRINAPPFSSNSVAATA
jgi:hypothetical protein